MKKTFRSILAGAVALLAVSCYDDSGLRKDIQKLDDRVTAIEAALNAEVNGINDLATRLAAAEQALSTTNTTVASLVTKLDAVDGKVDGKVADFDAAIATLTAADKTLDDKIVAAIAKIAVVKVDEKDGNVVLTLADNTTVALSKPLSNVENSGLVTITDDNMWAVVGADGTVTSLDVPVGHPDVTIEFQVASDGNLQYSVNDGEWMNTGVNTSDISGQKYVINDVVVADDEKSVSITIGDAEYVLPIYAPEEAVVVKIKSGKQYFAYEEAKSVDVYLAGVSSCVIMNKPDGWKAKLNGATLSVTAPAQAKIESGEADAEGSVVLHANGADGKCQIAILTVSTNASNGTITITVDAAGNITLKNTMLYTETTMWGESFTDFAGGYIGIATVAEYNSYATFEDFFNACVMSDEDEVGGFANLSSVKGNNDLGGYYIEGEYEEDEYTFSLETLAGSMWPRYQLEEGGQYVVWTVPQTSTNLLSEASIAFYEPVYVNYDVVTSWNDAVVSIETLAGAESYYFYFMQNDFSSDEEFNAYMQTVGGGFMPSGPWGAFVGQGDVEGLGMKVNAGQQLVLSEITFSSLSADTEYYVWVFPYNSAKPASEYDYATDFLPYVKKFKTNSIVEGDVALPTIANKAESYFSISADVTPAEGTVVYYAYMNAADWDNGEVTAMDVVNECYYPLTVAEGTQNLSPASYELSVAPGAGYYMVFVAVNADGNYAVLAEDFTTPALPYNEGITCTVESVDKAEGTNNYTVVLNVAGAQKLGANISYRSSYTESTFINNYLNKVAAGNAETYWTWGNVENGKVTLTFTTSYTYLVLSASNVADGVVTELSPIKILDLTKAAFVE